ncbi:MAG: hypothetical protein ACF8CY_03335, partial [Gimesia chilikensis]
MTCYRALILTFCVCLFSSSTIADAAESQVEKTHKKKVVLIAGPKSHGPVGNGIHDYPWSVK